MSDNQNNISEENNELPIPNEENESSVEVSETSEVGAGDQNGGGADISEEGAQNIKPPKRVSLFTFILSTVSLVLAAVMITYTVSSAMYRKKLVEVQLGEQSGIYYDEYGYPFALFEQFVDAYTFGEVDKDEMMANALKSYMVSTGDRYAWYYTEEEYRSMLESLNAEKVGVGILVIEDSIQINGNYYTAIKIVNVVKDSPAEKFGLREGDYIYGIGHGKDIETVDSIGYDVALAKILGDVGTSAKFTVFRLDGNLYEPIECTIERQKVTHESVLSHVHSTDKTIGVVRILQFDYKTPDQFSAAVDSLRAKGCTKFVFDLRYNGGGEVTSVTKILSHFLNRGDVVYRVLYKNGNEEFAKAEPIEYSGERCSIKESDIGKYKYLDAVVLCNGYTASAAEHFVAAFKAYNIGKTIGTKTYGKGSIQITRGLLENGYAYPGAIKLTVAKYFSGENGGYNDGFDGKGIEPDYKAELIYGPDVNSFYDLTDDTDTQMIEAITHFGECK